jgi:hypothetical protein
MISSLVLQPPSTLASFHIFGVISCWDIHFKLSTQFYCLVIFTLLLPSLCYSSNLPKELNLYFMAILVTDISFVVVIFLLLCNITI